MVRRVRSRGWIPAGLAFFLAAGWAAERAECFQAIREALRDPTVPTPMLNHGSVGGMLRRLRLVRPVRNDQRLHKAPVYPRPPLDASLFQKKRMVGGWLYVANPDWVQDLLAQPELDPPEADPALFRPGWPLVAIDVHRRDLFSSRWGIVANFLGRGREWERPSALSFYRDGQLILKARAGLRLHGGDSRLPGRNHSFRVHFRDEWGTSEFPRGHLFAPECEPIRRLVIRIDWPDTHPFAGLLAYDMAERIGCAVPRTEPVMLVLNGVLQTNIYHLSEHISPAAWANRLGHKDFLMYRMKSQQESRSAAAYEEFRQRVIFGPAPLDLATAEEMADLDNLSAYILSVVYGGTTDGFQGAAILNRRAEKPRWSWINWDMDHSFWDAYPGKEPRPAWAQESWDLVYKRKGDRNYPSWRSRGDVRAILFSRLMDECPAFRERFLRYAVDMLNHRLTDGFMQGRIDHYEALAKHRGWADPPFIADYRDFARHRPAVLREGLQARLGAGAIHRVEVRIPPEAAVRIDGFETTGSYEGYYFDGQTIAVEWCGEPSGESLGWQVDGTTTESGPRLVLPVRQDLSIGASTP